MQKLRFSWLDRVTARVSPFRALQRALTPAGVVVLVLGPVFFAMAEGATLLEIGGHFLDVYGLLLYGIYLAALAFGTASVYRSL